MKATEYNIIVHRGRVNGTVEFKLYALFTRQLLLQRAPLKIKHCCDETTDKNKTRNTMCVQNKHGRKPIPASVQMQLYISVNYNARVHRLITRSFVYTRPFIERGV